MTISFIFKKDWQGGSYVPPGSQMATRMMSFKKGQYVSGEVIANGNSPTADPANFIVITTPEGQARIPFGGKSYQGLNAILESPVAPWLSQAPVDTTPTGTDKGVVTKEKEPKYLTKRNAVILIILILIVIIYLIYRIRKSKK